MDKVLHVSAFQDNYIWLIQAESGAESVDGVAIVDPGEAQAVMRELDAHRLRPVAILCTHHHDDHVGGVSTLVQRYGIPVYGPRREPIATLTHRLDDGDRLDMSSLGLSFDVIATPGHTRGHIAFYCSNVGSAGMLFCGDTLFSAGCGRLFEGTPVQMHASLARLAMLPDDTRVYCAHEYTASNLRFALAVEPENRAAREHLQNVEQCRAQKLPTLPSTIGLERRINPFLRTSEQSIWAAVQNHTQRTLGSTVEVFAALRRWKDGFHG